jgi:O-antigen/teichoic acid export membrane protein
MTGLTWWYTQKFHPIRFGWDTTYIKHILSISLPYGLALFLNAIFFKVDTILLSVLENRAYADIAVALYALPMKIVEVGMMYGTIFLNSLLPVLTTAIDKNDTQKTKSLTKNAFQILFSFGAGISLFLYLFRSEIIHIISTPEYLTTTVG